MNHENSYLVNLFLEFTVQEKRPLKFRTKRLIFPEQNPNPVIIIQVLTIFACDRFVAKGQMSPFRLDWPFMY